MSATIGYGFAFENLRNQTVLATRREFLPGFKSTHHMHDFPQIWYCYKGQCTHLVNGTVYRCAEGSVILLPMGTPHQFWTDTGTELLFLNIHYNILSLTDPRRHSNAVTNLLLPAFFEGLGLSFSTYRLLSTNTRRIFEQVFSWFVTINYTAIAEPQIQQVWDHLETLFSTAEYALHLKNPQKVLHLLHSRVYPILQIVAYMNAHYPEKITEDALLETGNICRTAMYRHFKQLMGSTHAHFLQLLRLRRAHIYLRDSTYSLQELAELCGFYDRYHLSRAYSKCNGRTISQHRKRIAQCRIGETNDE